jgi:hypothetical protein
MGRRRSVEARVPSGSFCAAFFLGWTGGSETSRLARFLDSRKLERRRAGEDDALARNRQLRTRDIPVDVRWRRDDEGRRNKRAGTAPLT